jgi:hypothetical protein
MTKVENDLSAEPIDDGWTWAILEIFGHRRHVGRAREEEKFGSKLCRIDVPKLGEKGEITWSSHYYGGSSIFSFTPTDEQTVMKYAERAYTPAIPYRDHDDATVDDDNDDVDGEVDDDFN